MVQLHLLAALATLSITVLSSPLKTTRELNSISNVRHNKQPQPQPQQNGGQKCTQPPQSSPATPAKPATAKALYFLSNTPQNEIIALKVAADGTLSAGSQTCTNGAGSAGLTGAAKLPASPDPLFSQSSLKVSGSTLVAVNAGSNTLSMFNIDANDATKLTMVGAPVSTLGEFPVSVAVSDKLKMACVANSGAKAGIACFSIDAVKGLTAMDKALRPIELGQTTPPVGPTNTVSHIFFNEDSSALLTTVKGDPPTNKTGFLSVFPVVNGAVGTQDTRSSPNGTAVLFGSAVIPGSSNVFVTDASFGAAILSLPSPNSNATVLAKTPIANQKATCWATISAQTKSAFVTDVAANHLVEIDTASGKILGTLESKNGNGGMIDLVSAGGFVYALAATKGDAAGKGVQARVVVFEVGAGGAAVKEIQNFVPVGVAGTAQGMTFL